MEIKNRVRRFIAQNFYLPGSDGLTDGASLLDCGVVDSTGVLELIGFLEETFEVTVEDAEMLPDNLDSIERIATFVTRKQGV